jgi:hypothetical protein
VADEGDTVADEDDAVAVEDEVTAVKDEVVANDDDNGVLGSVLDESVDVEADVVTALDVGASPVTTGTSRRVPEYAEV